MTDRSLLRAIERIPPGFFVRFANERNTEDGRLYLDASIYQEPPEGGWSVRGVDPGPYNEVLGSDQPGAYHPADKYRPRVLWGISAVNHRSFLRLLINSITERWP